MGSRWCGTDARILIREIKEIPGIEMVTLTTNGILLQSMLPKLLEAGVDAVNVSLDTFQRARYEHLTGKDACEMVLAGIQDAYKSGIPLKLNCVPIEGKIRDNCQNSFPGRRGNRLQYVY